MSEPTKAELMRALIVRLRQSLQTAAGGVDPRVQEVLEEMDKLLQPVS